MQEVMIIQHDLSFIIFTADLLTLFKDGIVIKADDKECFVKYAEFSALFESKPQLTRRRLNDDFTKQA